MKFQRAGQKTFTIFLAILLTITTFSLQSVKTVHAWALDCTDAATLATMQIDQAQCEALESIYDNLGGGSWANGNTGTGSGSWGEATDVDTWHGVTRTGGNITLINLDSNNLSGDLNLADLSNLTSLQYLILSYNQLTGNIPNNWNNFTSLYQLALNNNQLTGTLPTNWGGWAGLHRLSINNNQLSGSIPANWSNLTALTNLSLRYNELNSVVPDLRTTYINYPGLLLCGGENIITPSGTAAIDNHAESIDHDWSNWSATSGCPTPEIDVQRPSGTTIGDGTTDDIGYQAVGTVVLDYVVDNTSGTADLTIPVNGVTASGHSNSSSFSVNTALPLTIAAGGTETLEVSFDVDATGAFSFDMAIESNDGDENPYDIHVQGIGAASGVVINEVDADTPGSDTAEFIELYDGGTGNTSLEGLVLILYNGADDASYRSFDLDGEATNANGYFVAGNTSVTNVDITFGNGTLQNGTDAVALYVGDSADFPNDTPVTTTNLVDAIIYETNDGDAPGLRVLLNSGQPIANETVGPDATLVSNQRCPNGTGGKRNTNTYGQYSPTPGELNCPPEINIERPASTTIVDGGTDAQGNKRSGEQSTLTYTVRNTGSSTLTVSDITATNESNVSIGTITPTNFTVTTGNTATFDVPYTPVAGNGAFSLELDIANNDSDEGNYDITVSGTRDGIAPSVTAIDRASANPTNAAGVDFDVTFSEVVADIEIGDFALAFTGSATGTINSVSTSSGTTVTVNVNNMSGDGTLGLNFDYDALDSVSDSVGNTAISDFNGQIYTIDNTAPSVAIEQAAGQADPTNTSPIIFDVIFSENITGFDDSDVNISGMAGIPGITVNGANDTYTVEVTGMADGETVTATISANTAQDEAGNNSLASTSADNSVTYDITGINILGGGIIGEPNTETIQDLSVHNTLFTNIKISFNSDAANPAGDTDPDDVTNPNNFLLIQSGANSHYDTASCLDYSNNGNIVLGDDVQISTGPISYDAAAFIATLTLNNGTPLPVGEYRLLICGTTSITDSAGNALNNGNDVSTTFSIATASSLPETGFRHGGVTQLPEQPAAKAYTDTAMLLEIPKVGVSMPIVGVPQSADGWDVTWLGNSAGYLAGSAFPTWAGNTVITAHVWDAYNQPGIFSELKTLKYGDQVQIQAWGLTYSYEVRESKLLTKKNVNAAFQSEEYDWLTLLTCEFYNPFSGDYLFRRAVKAVLVNVK